jgi:hypothetical protein
MTKARLAVAGILLFVAGGVVATTLDVDVSVTRSSEEAVARADQAVRLFGWNAARLTERVRRAMGISTPFSLPVRVSLRVGGRPLPPPPSGTRGSGIQLVFADSGPRAFPPDYRALLESVFQRAQPILDAVFGAPARGGQVFVSNFDADIGDRDAVAGGYYLNNNGAGQSEIRFPIYLLSEAAAVNFLHCVLLAYVGPRAFPEDAFQEGIVRAATMRVARIPGALPAFLDRAKIEEVLEGTYDAGPFYDWWNQRSLGSRLFIAPNLRERPLPPGGSVGGLYLVRYQMAGSAWAKALVEYPALFFQLMPAYYALGRTGTRAEIIQLVQDAIGRIGGSTIEGQTVSDWFDAQGILDTAVVPGLKLHVQPFPIVDGLGRDDFGVFGVQAHWFESRANGDEILLSSRAFPIFWDPFFNRFFTGAAEDRMEITGAYGAVAPNFPDLLGGDPYRVAVDIPVQGRLQRVFLPAGAIATFSRPTPNEVFGTVNEFASPATPVRVSLDWGSGQANGIPVRNLAFGARIADPSFLEARVVRVRVSQVVGGSEQVVLSRQINKTVGPLALDLRVGEVRRIGRTLPAGVSFFGVSFEPAMPLGSAFLGLTEPETQIARLNPGSGRYDFYPDSGPISQGVGFFARLDRAVSGDVSGATLPSVPTGVHLRPGWNQIANPLLDPVATSRILVVTSLGFPVRLNEASQRAVQPEVFEYLPGPPDALSGVSETGTIAAATVFEPGKGYFVRCLDPDGATLLFLPGGGREPRGQDRPLGWRLGLSLAGGSQGRVNVLLGGAPGATLAFDPGLDAALPPALTPSLSAHVLGSSEPLYQDLRRPGATHTFRVSLDGLSVGRRYRLSVTRDIGRWDRADVRIGRIRRLFTRPGSLVFIASAPSMEATVVAGGRP